MDEASTQLDVVALVQLAASGNSRTVEELWMAALEAHAHDPAEVVSWSPLLEELVRLERSGEAADLAWAAIEAVQEMAGVQEALKVAGPFLLVVSQSELLKTQVADLYRAVYADREHLEVLLEEAGIAGGRPARRALRTLEVCLNVAAGSFLAARHRYEAARVEAIDSTTWAVTVETPDGRRTSGPVALADEYAPAEADDFRVLRRFAPERLRAMLAGEPDQVVISILRAHGDRLDSAALAALLTPALVPAEEWTRWWSKARAALKHHPNVRITGRAPHEIAYHTEAVSRESETEAQFKRLHDPVEQLACLEAYLRDCRSSDRAAELEMLARCKKRLDQTAQRQIKAGGQGALTSLLVSRGVSVAMGAGEEEADRPVVEFLLAAPDPAEWLKGVASEALFPAAFHCLQRAHPAQYVEYCAALLPEAPAEACDLLAGVLVAGGFERAQLEALVQRILNDPIRHVGALAWLWRGPQAELNIPLPSPPTLCAKVLGVAAEVKRCDELPREVRKRIQDRVRDCLSANQYARFKACLEEAGAEVAAMWRKQIVRLDNLGRAVPEDLNKLIRAAFPLEHRAPEISPWAREDVVYTTAGGRQRLSGEIETVNTKMRANAKAIGEAAAHGDLSENSEYKFALEERDLLRARLAQLQGQLAQVVVLEAGEISENHVGFGTRVTLRGTGNGEIFQMTFLGPWEAEADRGVYNYKSPVGQQLMGLRPGDTVDLAVAAHPGVYVIEQIENALRKSAAEQE